MTSTETIPPSAIDDMTDDMNDDMRSIYMSTKTEPLRQALLEHLPVRERIELIPVHEILERLPVQDVIERLPQRFRPEPPKKKSRMKPMLLALLAIGAIAAFMMMKRRRADGAGQMPGVTDTGMVGAVPTTGAGYDDSSPVGTSASLP